MNLTLSLGKFVVTVSYHYSIAVAY
jgi:hypothetical protein